MSRYNDQYIKYFKEAKSDIESQMDNTVNIDNDTFNKKEDVTGMEEKVCSMLRQNENSQEVCLIFSGKSAGDYLKEIK